MTSSGQFAVNAFGCRIQVGADTENALAVLDRYVFPTLPRTVHPFTEPDLELRVVDRREWELYAGGEVIGSFPDVEGLVPPLIHAIDEAVLGCLTSLRAVHAGTVLWNGRAILLAGPTHAGKSSLVAELLRRGATYFSDEYALIDADGLVHPYPRPLLLRNETGDQFPVLASEIGAETGNVPVPAGWIFSVAYRPGSAWPIAPVPQSIGLLMLLQNTPHLLERSPEMVQFFERAVRGAVCLAGERDEVASAADEILKMIRDPGVDA